MDVVRMEGTFTLQSSKLDQCLELLLVQSREMERLRSDVEAIKSVMMAHQEEPLGGTSEEASPSKSPAPGAADAAQVGRPVSPPVKPRAQEKATAARRAWSPRNAVSSPRDSKNSPRSPIRSPRSVHLPKFSSFRTKKNARGRLDEVSGIEVSSPQKTDVKTAEQLHILALKTKMQTISALESMIKDFEERRTAAANESDRLMCEQKIGELTMAVTPLKLELERMISDAESTAAAGSKSSAVMDVKSPPKTTEQLDDLALSTKKQTVAGLETMIHDLQAKRANASDLDERLVLEKKITMLTVALKEMNGPTVFHAMLPRPRARKTLAQLNDLALETKRRTLEGLLSMIRDMEVQRAEMAPGSPELLELDKKLSGLTAAVGPIKNELEELLHDSQSEYVDDTIFSTEDVTPRKKILISDELVAEMGDISSMMRNKRLVEKTEAEQLAEVTQKLAEAKEAEARLLELIAAREASVEQITMTEESHAIIGDADSVASRLRAHEEDEVWSGESVDEEKYPSARGKADIDRFDAEQLVEETERIAKEEADRIAKEEADRIAKEDTDRIAKEEADRIAKEDTDRIAREELERAKADAKEKRLRRLAELKSQSEAAKEQPFSPESETIDPSPPPSNESFVGCKQCLDLSDGFSNCSGFQPNIFRKTRCQSCGHSVTSHASVDESEVTADAEKPPVRSPASDSEKEARSRRVQEKLKRMAQRARDDSEQNEHSISEAEKQERSRRAQEKMRRQRLSLSASGDG